jgi:hypothetical protein
MAVMDEGRSMVKASRITTVALLTDSGRPKGRDAGHLILAWACSCGAPLRAASHRLRQTRAAFASCQRASAEWHALRPASTYVMLVESDVRGGVRGMLP